MIFEKRSAIVSAEIVETVFGVISPNTRINKVSTPVANPTLSFPHSLVASRVESEDAYRFTMLFPIRIVEISLS